jgi:hypothetical protein
MSYEKDEGRDVVKSYKANAAVKASGWRQPGGCDPSVPPHYCFPPSGGPFALLTAAGYDERSAHLSYPRGTGGCHIHQCPPGDDRGLKDKDILELWTSVDSPQEPLDLSLEPRMTG